MKPSRVRLAVAAVLFAAWIGWLVYLSATTTRPLVLSRPQFLAASLYVIADLKAGPDEKAPAEEATIKKVIWPAHATNWMGSDEIKIKNLPLCGEPYGWKGAGEYLLPLTQIPGPEKMYLVTPIPRSPGYYGHPPSPKVPGRIYPATPTARRELRDLVAEFHQAGE